MGGARDNVRIACPNRKHFDVLPGARGTARVWCREKRCKLADEIVIHYFDLATGDLIETRRYDKPPGAALSARTS